MKSLEQFPTEFTTLCEAALRSPAKFPIPLTFPTLSKAISFRTRFYEFRRALRHHIHPSDIDSPYHIARTGADLISSPRAITTPEGLGLTTFQLVTQSATYADGLAGLRTAFAEGQEHASPVEPDAEGQEASPTDEVPYQPHRRKSITKADPTIRLTLGYTEYAIPRTHINDKLLASDKDALTRALMLLSKGLGSDNLLRNSLDTYVV